MASIFHLVAGAPDPVAPFSHAVEAAGWVFVTGQMPFTGTSVDEPYPQGIETQTHQVRVECPFATIRSNNDGLPEELSRGDRPRQQHVSIQ